MKRCLSFIFAVISWGAVFCQQHVDAAEQYSDSLDALVRQSPNDSIKINRLLELSFFWSDRDTARAFGYIAEAVTLAGKKPNEYQKGLLAHFTANVIYTHDIEKAKSLYMQADRYFARNKTAASYSYRSRAWSNYGTLLQIQDSADQFMNIIIEKALPLGRLAGDSIAVGNHLQNIGLLMMNVQDHDKADIYFQQAIHTFSGFSEAHEEKLTVFVNASKNALLNLNYRKARTHLDSAARQLVMIPHSAYAPYYYRSEGIYFRKMNQKSDALRNFYLGIEAAKVLSDEYSLRDIYFEIYATYRDFGEYEAAKKHLEMADSYVPNTISHNLLLHQREMAFTEFNLGNYKAAFEKMKAYAMGRDTLESKNLTMKILDLEKKYQTVEKENEILRLQDANQKQQASIDKNRFWNSLLIAGLIITFIVIYFSWRLLQSKRNALVQTEKLHSEELSNLKQREKLHQYSSMLQWQEDERNRIARDLHDGLGGLLAGAKLRLSTIASKSKQSKQSPNEGIDVVIRELDHSVDELRRIARNMMPESLLYMGLEPAITDLCKYLDTPATAVKSQAFNLSDSHPKPILIGVYRIVQELLNNAINHAKAKQIIIQVSESNHHLFLTVEDDGCGFDQSWAVKNGMGLKNIENRVALMQGKFEIDSSPSHGTTVNIEIPLNHGQ